MILGTVSLLDKNVAVPSPRVVKLGVVSHLSGPGCRLGLRLRLWCFTSTQTIRLIRDGRMAVGEEEGRIHTYRYTVTTRMTPALYTYRYTVTTGMTPALYTCRYTVTTGMTPASCIVYLSLHCHHQNDPCIIYLSLHCHHRNDSCILHYISVVTLSPPE